jgi:1A family penicillin-binding protein
LARNIYLSQKKAFTRKAREAVLAVMIERNYTKSKILELYLNQVFYGSGAFGVEAAAKTYFGKDASELDLAECALIAGLPQRPTDYSPHVDLEAAVNRRNVVLDRMAELGKITPEERDKAKAEKPRIVPLKPTKYRSKAPYFTDYVKRYLREKYEYGDDLIYRGGLRVYTTLNYQMQVAAQKAVTEGIGSAIRGRQMNALKGNGALVCVEPSTGYIRAMVGGTSYEKSEFNRAIQAQRQPGSSFKAFVYTAAVAKLDWNANHVVQGGRYSYSFGDGRVWSPRNYDDRYPGAMTIKQAVAKSVNVPAVRTAMEVGLGEVIKYARIMGIKSDIEQYPALAIGGIKGIRVLEMASAYNVFASGGVYAEPTPIVRITDSQDQVYDEQPPENRPALQQKTVKVMDELFRAVVTSGTGRSVSSIPEARGKTGTTNADVDAWFIGYVPGKLTCAVWAGNDDHTPMSHVWGGNVCAPIWKKFMQTALRVQAANREKDKTADKPQQPKQQVQYRPTRPEPTGETQTQTPPEQDINEEFNLPNETEMGTVRVKICEDSQLLATRACTTWHTEEFEQGAQPTQYCNIHGSRRQRGTENGTNPSPRPTTTGEGGGYRMTPPPPILPDH